MSISSPAHFLLVLAIPPLLGSQEIPPVNPQRFGIQVVDASGRGVSLVELRTVNGIRHYSDNAGWICWEEPGMMDQEVFWHVSGPGIIRRKDGFGYAGFRAQVTPGRSVKCQVEVTNIATRLGRLTGQGLYRHAMQLGLYPEPPKESGPLVLGQDSVQAVPFGDKIFWLWGDTNVPNYPLGNFFTTGAITALTQHPEQGLAFSYFTKKEAPTVLRPMLPASGPGVVWMFGLLNVNDVQGRERLLSGFSRQPGLAPPVERGVAEFDSALGQFKKILDVPKNQEWPLPGGHAVRVTDTEGDFFYFCRPFAHVRVKATYEAVTDPKAYQMLQWQIDTNSWKWASAGSPTSQEDENRLLEQKSLPAAQARYALKDAANSQAIKIHSASITWNAWRKKFILIGLQMATDKTAPSHLGEVWYAEAPHITGPWHSAVKIASHPQYSFYNPIHHTFFDREQGRLIYFEATYTQEFSGNPTPTPRYDYNQLLYRLDLADARLKPVQED